MRALSALALSCSLVAPAAGQALRGGDLVTTNFQPPEVYRIDHTGAVSLLLAGAPLASPAGVAAMRSGDVAVADFNSSSLVLIDRVSGNPTTIANVLGGPLRVVEDLAGDFLVSSNSQRAVLRVRRTGAVTTLASGPPFSRPFGLAVDLDGSVLVTDDLGRAVYRVDPSGMVSTVYSGPPLRLPQGIALFPNGDYAVIDGVTDEVYRIARGTGNLTTFVNNAALAGNPEGIVPDFGGGFLVSQSMAGLSRIQALDPLGNVSTVASGPPFSNLEDVARLPVSRAPRVLTTGPGGVAGFDLELPGSPGALYTMVLSMSAYPGWPLPGSDPRSLVVNPDAFFFATLLANAPPILTNWTASLDGAGRGSAAVDLQFLPAGALAGLAFFHQGFTLSAASSNGIGAPFNVLRIDLR